MDKPMSHCSTDIATLSQNINDMLAAHDIRGYESSSSNNDALTFGVITGDNITLTLPAVAMATARCMMLTYFFMQLSRFFDKELGFDEMKIDLENKQGAMDTWFQRAS